MWCAVLASCHLILRITPGGRKSYHPYVTDEKTRLREARHPALGHTAGNCSSRTRAEMRLLLELWLLPTACPTPAAGPPWPMAGWRQSLWVQTYKCNSLWVSYNATVGCVWRGCAVFAEVFELPRLVHLCLQRRKRAGSGASLGARDPALQLPFIGRGLLKDLELREPSPSSERSQEVTLPRHRRIQRENGHHSVTCKASS